MYGLVNTAIADLTREVGGEAAWTRVCALADVPQGTFVGMTGYPDDVTYRLVAAASSVLDLSVEEILTAFGRHWVSYTAQQGWGPLLQAAGSTLPEVLGGLDAMHARVRLLMPELQPPSFRCSDVTPTTLRLHYYSDRPGLAAMVIGLVEGLAVLLGETATATHVEVAADGADHDEFVVRYARTAP
ncbi:MAG TPA: heme NO-binding domain-containing protein [Actinomycetales bacterium]|jgi:hypothetical protein